MDGRGRAPGDHLKLCADCVGKYSAILPNKSDSNADRKIPPPVKKMQEKSSEGMTVDLKSDKKGGHGDRENGQERDHQQAWPGLDLDCGFLKKRQKREHRRIPTTGVYWAAEKCILDLVAVMHMGWHPTVNCLSRGTIGGCHVSPAAYSSAKETTRGGHLTMGSARRSSKFILLPASTTLAAGITASPKPPIIDSGYAE